MVELNHINLATKEDKAYGIDKWAALFKATTWEEIRMLAEKDPYIEMAANSIYSSVTDPKILEILRVRDEEIRGDIHRRERLFKLIYKLSASFMMKSASCFDRYLRALSSSRTYTPL